MIDNNDTARQALSALESGEPTAEAKAASLLGEVERFRELNTAGWFDEIAEFLDDYTDAEIIDGTTHPNKAMRLLRKLQELGL